MTSQMLSVIRNLLKNAVENGIFAKVLDKVNITSIDGDGNLKAEMEVTEEHTNIAGTLHGGLLATIVDQLSSYSLTSVLLSRTPSEISKHVSVELSLSFQSAVKVGETILIDSKILKIGKNLAFLNVDIFNKKNGNLVATGKHTKYILNRSAL